MKFSYTQRIQKVIIFFIKKPNLTKKKKSGGWEGVGGVARVSDFFFFFQKNPSLKKNCFFLRGWRGSIG